MPTRDERFKLGLGPTTTRDESASEAGSPTPYDLGWREGRRVGYDAGSAATLARIVAEGRELMADLTKHQVGVAFYDRRVMADGIGWLLDHLERGAARASEGGE